MEKILILGKGYVGNHLYSYFKKHNASVDLVGKSDVDYTDEQTYINLIQNYTTVITAYGYTGKPNVDAVGLPENLKDAVFLNVELPLKHAIINNKYNITHHHISTGCIYTYDKYDSDGNPIGIDDNLFHTEFTEEDYPNFGLGFKHSSKYSYLKHMSESNISGMAYQWRIRMPYNTEKVSKNILYKMTQQYKTILSCMNSLTNLDTLGECILRCINEKWKLGIYNVVNGHTDAKTMREIYSYVLGKSEENPEYINYIQLKQSGLIKENRSNCKLSNQKILSHGIRINQLEDDIRQIFFQWNA